MDYKEVLEDVLGKVKGAIYLTFCGSDGLGIAQSSDTVLPPDIELGDEKIASFLVTKMSVIKEMNLSQTKEDITITDHYVVLVRMVSSDYFISMVCTHAVDIKIARYYMYKLANTFKKHLT